MKRMSTPNVQLPIPKENRPDGRDGSRSDQLFRPAFPQSGRSPGLGSWKVGVGSCLLAVSVASAVLTGQTRLDNGRLLKPGTDSWPTFNGDYTGLTVNRGNQAHPIWSDTRNADPFTPDNGVVNDEDAFTASVTLPSGKGTKGTGHLGKN